MEPKMTVGVDVISDVVCPWCFVGQRNLERANALLSNIDVPVRWRPFQLDPTIPPEGLERESYMLLKFGSRERIAAAHDRLREIGMAAGINFDFEAISIAPNTLDAHRVIRWAGGADDRVQSRLVAHLFRLYFEEGQNIGDRAVLISAAGEAGMDRAVVESLLPTPADRQEVQAEIATAQRMGVTGVPCFLLEGRYALMGAQPPEALADAIRKVAEAKASGEFAADAPDPHDG